MSKHIRQRKKSKNQFFSLCWSCPSRWCLAALVRSAWRSPGAVWPPALWWSHWRMYSLWPSLSHIGKNQQYYATYRPWVRKGRTIFLSCIPNEDLARPRYQLNISKTFSNVLFGSTVEYICGEVQLAASGTTYIQKEVWNYSNNLIEKISLSWLQLQRWSLECVISFSEIFVWELKLRLGQFIMGSCIPNPIRVTKFQDIYITISEKYKSFLGPFTPQNQILISKNIWLMNFYIWFWKKAQIYSC
jgi:hypothetical protein